MNEQEKKERRAQDAKRLLNDPLFKESIETLRKTCFHNIESSSYDQEAQREDLYYMLRCITALEKQLKNIIQEGKAVELNFNLRKLTR